MTVELPDKLYVHKGTICLKEYLVQGVKNWKV